MPRAKKKDSEGYAGQPCPPHWVLQEYMEDEGWGVRETARRSGLEPSTVSALARGKYGISAKTAVGLERAFGRPARWWMELQLLWELDQERRRQSGD